MADCYFPLDVDVRHEGPLVVDAEGENTVLIWQLEGDAENGAVDCFGDWLEVQAVEGGEHGEFELESIRGGYFQRHEVVVRIFG